MSFSLDPGIGLQLQGRGMKIQEWDGTQWVDKYVVSAEGNTEVKGTLTVDGTVDMNSDLTVGSVSIGTSNANGYKLYVAGDAAANSFNAVSLRSKKKEIEQLDKNALEIINSVNIVEFKYKEIENDRKHIGFIADDTEKILSGPKQDSFLIADTLAVVVKAIQELKQEIDNLKKGLDYGY